MAITYFICNSILKRKDFISFKNAKAYKANKFFERFIKLKCTGKAHVEISNSFFDCSSHNVRKCGSHTVSFKKSNAVEIERCTLNHTHINDKQMLLTRNKVNVLADLFFI